MPWLASLPLRKARFVDGPVDDVLMRHLHRLADAAYPDLLRALLAVLAETGASIPAVDLTSRVVAGDIAALEEVLRQAWLRLGERGLQDALAPSMQALALQAAQVTTLPGLAVAFNVADPLVLVAIDRVVAQQITGISAATQEAIQGIVRRAIESGQSIGAQIQEIRQLVGLTPRQAASVARYRAGLREAGTAPERVETLVERRSAFLRRQRAITISRTETMNAVSAGAYERLQQAVRAGYADATRLRRYWLVAPGERTCPICTAIPGLNPDGVGVSEPFQTPVGPVLYPTVHPCCRCIASVRIVAGVAAG